MHIAVLNRQLAPCRSHYSLHLQKAAIIQLSPGIIFWFCHLLYFVCISS